MEIFDSRYYIINKRLLRFIGLWPYEKSRSKIVRRIILIIMVIAMVAPHILGIFINFGKNNDIFLEHMGVIFYIMFITMKILSSIVYEDQLRMIYNDIPINWSSITDDDERRILSEYSENGRVLSISYGGYLLTVLITFLAVPLIPVTLNAMNPGKEVIPKLYILNGEFLVDKEAHFWKIYVYDCFGITTSVIVVVACDNMYAASIEHCLGLFAIIKYRLKLHLTTMSQEEVNCKKDEKSSYTEMQKIIELHNKALKFTDILENTYSKCFFIVMGVNLIYVSLIFVMILVSADNLLNMIRYILLAVGIAIHLFYLSLPGQRLMDHSSGLHQDAYLNDWYDTSEGTKKLLNFFMMRCSRASTITAGGLYVLNFENFITVMRKSISFIAVFSSIR